jgi:polygalacturonase
MRRRNLLAALPLVLPGLSALATEVGKTTQHSPNTWNIADLGAVPDGKTLNTKIIQDALDRASTTGGGTVLIPAGSYLTGGLTIGSNTILHLEAGAVLQGSGSLEDYAITTGNPDSNRHLLSALHAHDITITGLGVIDGSGSSFWHPSNRKPVPEDEQWRDVAIFDWEVRPAPAPMIKFHSCKNLLLQGVTVRNSPRWTLVFQDCDTVRVDGIRIRNPRYIPETDGINITCCRDVVITGCDISTGDDAVCLKSEGEITPTRNVLVTNCRLTSCCNGFKIGTGSKGSFQKIEFTHSTIYNTERAVNARIIAAVALEVVDGGSIDGVKIADIKIRNARTPIFIRLGSRSGGKGSLQNVTIDNLNATGAILTSSITGIPGSVVHNVTIRNTSLSTDEGGEEAWVRKQIDEIVPHYPEARMFGRLPAYGFYLRHASGIQFSNVEITADRPDPRPALVFDDVQDIDLGGLKASAPLSHQPVVSLHDCRRAILHDLTAPVGKVLSLQVTGASTEGIRLVGKQWKDAKDAVLADDLSKITITP